MTSIRTQRTFARFNLIQRVEHALLLLSGLVLFLTGIPQKYRAAEWSQQLLSTPERLQLLQTIHRIAAVILILEVLYHLGNALVLLARRRLPGDMLPTMRDVKDAVLTVAYLLFLRKEKPAYGKYNFEQKFTYWFLFFGIGIMVVSGLVLWFPEFLTQTLPGRIIPAAKLAHSTEAVAAAVFVAVWHLYHVHIERLNLSIFTGWLTEEEMRTYHKQEYERLAELAAGETEGERP